MNSSGVYPYIQIQGNIASSNTDTGNGVTMGIYNDDAKINYEMTRITMECGSSNSNIIGFGNLLFSTKAGLSNLMKEAMRITYDKNVGIGTKTPSEKLSIYDGNIQILGSNVGLLIQDTSNINSTLLNNDGLFYKNSNYYISYINNSNQINKAIGFDSNLNTRIYNNLYVNSNVYTSNFNVSGIISLNTLGVSGTANLNSNLIVLGSSTFSNTLNVIGVTTLSNNLNVTGITTLNSTNITSLNNSGITILGSTLNVTGTASLSNNLNVTGAAFLSNNLNVAGITTLNSTNTTSLNNSGTATLGSTLNVTGAATLSNNLLVLGISTHSGSSIFNNTTTFNSNVIFSLPIFLNSNLNVAGVTTLNGTNTTTLNNSGITVLGSTLNVTGATSLSNNLSVSGITTLVNTNTTSLNNSGTLNVTGATSFSNNLNVSGTTTLTNTSTTSLNNSGITTLGNTLNVTGATILSNNLNVLGVSTLANTTTIALNNSGTTILGGTLNITGSAALSNNLNVLGISTLANTNTTSLNNTGITTLGSTLNIAGATALSNNFSVLGVSTLANTTTTSLNNSGTTILGSTLNVTGAAAFSNNLNVTGITTLNSTNTTSLNNSGTTLLGNTLNVTGVTSLSNNLNVTGISTLSGTAATSINNSGITTLGNTLNVTGATALSNNLNVLGVSTLANTITTSLNNFGTTTLGSTLNVTGATAFSNNFNVLGVSTLTNTTTTSLNNFGPTILGGTLQVAGSSALNSNLILNSYMDLSNIIQPTYPVNSNMRLYFNSNTGFLEGLNTKNNSNILTTFNPTSNIGDIMVHNGITQTALPVGTINQILYCNPAISNKLGWKDISSDTGAPNLDTSKFFNGYNTTATPLNVTTYTDIIWDGYRIYDSDFFTVINDIEIQFNFTGIYTVFVNVSAITTVADNFSACRFKVQKSTQGGAYTDIVGANCYTNHDLAIATSSGSASMYYIESATINDKIKVNGIIFSGKTTNTVTLITNGCEIIVSRIHIDDIFDSTLYIDSYITTTKTLTQNTYADITFDVNRISNSYTHTAGSALFTVSNTGLHLIIAKIHVAANAKSFSTSQLLTNTSGSFVVIPGSIVNTYQNDATNNDGSSAISVIVQLNAGDSIKLQSQTNVATTTTVSDGTSMYITCLKSTTNNQTTVKHICAYNTTAITINATYTDITYQGLSTTNAIYSFTTNTAPITFNQTGKYLVSYRATIINTNILNANKDLVGTRLVSDTGNGAGFNEIAASSTSKFAPSATVYKNSLISQSVLYIQSGTIIKMQAIKIGGNGTIATVANGSSFSIIKLDNAPVVNSVIAPILNYGTFYQLATNKSTSSTTSTVYTQKLLMTTTPIPNGTYRVGINYQLTNSANKDLSIRIVVDNINVIHEQILIFASSATFVFYDFENIVLTTGVHTISMEYRSNTAGTAAAIFNTKLEFYRVM